LRSKKQAILDEITQRKETLFGIVQESREVQNKALKMTRIIRADKDAYLKLGNLQQTTNKGQTSLKGWKPDNATTLAYSQKKAHKELRNNSITHQSIESLIQTNRVNPPSRTADRSS